MSDCLKLLRDYRPFNRCVYGEKKDEELAHCTVKHIAEHLKRTNQQLKSTQIKSNGNKSMEIEE